MVDGFCVTIRFESIIGYYQTFQVDIRIERLSGLKPHKLLDYTVEPLCKVYEKNGIFAT